jgi:hypothetical protein
MIIVPSRMFLQDKQRLEKNVLQIDVETHMRWVNENVWREQTHDHCEAILQNWLLQLERGVRRRVLVMKVKKTSKLLSLENMEPAPIERILAGNRGYNTGTILYPYSKFVPRRVAMGSHGYGTGTRYELQFFFAPPQIATGMTRIGRM